ncbi:MAG: tRNA lysidine(34) synthetase TilS, partial [Acetobacteraceae bacterium]|nr:tRNA lysidine(34) synthetase TilS [Acetobacteraceae bacterium]
MAPLGPFGAAPGLAVAVSGGPHSLALALLARDWVAARGGRLVALVADHGLRPESGAEAAHVIGLLTQAGITAECLRLGLPVGARLQERARLARLAALAQAAARHG